MVDLKFKIKITGMLNGSLLYFYFKTKPIVINSLNSVAATNNMSDVDQISEAANDLIMPVNISIQYILPTSYKDIAISWISSNGVITISSGNMTRIDSLESDIDFNLTATFSLNNITQ